MQTQFFVRDVINGFTRNVASVLENFKEILTSDVVCVSGNAAGMGKCKNGVEFLNGNKIDVVDKFCYLGDMIGSGSGVEETSQTRVRCAWAKFRELSQILTKRGVTLKIKGKLYTNTTQHTFVCKGC